MFGADLHRSATRSLCFPVTSVSRHVLAAAAAAAALKTLFFLKAEFERTHRTNIYTESDKLQPIDQLAAAHSASRSHS